MALLFNPSETDPTTSGVMTSDERRQRKVYGYLRVMEPCCFIGLRGFFLDGPASLQSQLFSIFLANMQVQVQVQVQVQY